MILFCDSSALLKLYVEEKDSAVMREQAGNGEVLAASRVTYAECMAAFARHALERPEDDARIEQLRGTFSDDWSGRLHVDVTQPLVEAAGEYAATFALRGYDSVQLASVHFLHRELPGQVRFACFDNRLNRAARVLCIAFN